MKFFFVNILTLIAFLNIVPIYRAVSENASPIISQEIHSTIFQNLSNELKVGLSNTCPQLLLNPLVNLTSEYYKDCQNISRNDVINIHLNSHNKDSYLCLAVLHADIQLCKTTLKKKSELPKNMTALKDEIKKISSNNLDSVCKEFQKYNFTEGGLTSKYMLELSQFLSSSDGCQKICIGWVGEKTNSLCSLLLFIYRHIQNIKSEPPGLVTVNKNVSMTRPQPKGAVISLDEIKVKPEESENRNITDNDNKPMISSTTEINPNSSQVISHGLPMEIQKISPQKITALPESAMDSKTTQTVQKQPSEKQVFNKHAVATEKLTDIITNRKVTDSKESIDKKPQESFLESISSKANSGLDSIIPNTDEDAAYQEGTDTDIDVDPGYNTVPQREENFISPPVKNDMNFDEVEDSNFFSYFMFISVIFICGYIAYHNKQKILALVLEGRKDRTARRRPNTASYRKLNSNLEEAVTSKSGGSAAHVIY